MKKFLTTLCLLFLVSYSYASEVPSHRIIKNGGVAFEMGSNNPFTGTSTSYCENTQPKEIITYKKGITTEVEFFSYYDNDQLRKYVKSNKESKITILYRKDGRLYAKEIEREGKENEEEFYGYEGEWWEGNDEGSPIGSCDTI